MTLNIDAHELLDARVFVTEFSRPLGNVEPQTEIVALLAENVIVPVTRPENVQGIVRDLLRLGGYKPTGRGKPASEYLIRAVSEGKLSAINLAVDICNVVSLHSGLPISVVDMDATEPPLQIKIAERDSEYMFNATGQTIRLDGLLCLFDTNGPCANGVKDSQRTKTSGDTVKTLSVVWGTKQLAGHTNVTTEWYQTLLRQTGATVSDVSPA